MPAIDTVLGQVTNSVALANITVAAGDTLSVRSFQPPARAMLDDFYFKGGQATTVRITSPYLHDLTRGITKISAQAPTIRNLPPSVWQALSPQDQLAVQLNSGGANSSVVALRNYYTDLGAANARLVMPGDIAGLIDDVKPIEVDVTASATIGQWNDTAATTTENLLRANTDYAILGYTVDVACLCVAIRGQDTGNLRISGPGSTLQLATDSYFVDYAEATGRPYIPVINAANINNTSVSVADNAAGTAVKVQLIAARLTQNLAR